MNFGCIFVHYIMHAIIIGTRGTTLKYYANLTEIVLKKKKFFLKNVLPYPHNTAIPNIVTTNVAHREIYRHKIRIARIIIVLIPS